MPIKWSYWPYKCLKTAGSFQGDSLKISSMYGHIMPYHSISILLAQVIIFLHLGSYTWKLLVTTTSLTRFTNRSPRSWPIAIAQSNAQRFTFGRLTTRLEGGNGIPGSYAGWKFSIGRPAYGCRKKCQFSEGFMTWFDQLTPWKLWCFQDFLALPELHGHEFVP